MGKCGKENSERHEGTFGESHEGVVRSRIEDAETSAVVVNEDMIRYPQIREELRQIIVKKEK